MESSKGQFKFKFAMYHDEKTIEPGDNSRERKKKRDHQCVQVKLKVRVNAG